MIILFLKLHVLFFEGGGGGKHTALSGYVHFEPISL
jgi:hypothetical protein